MKKLRALAAERVGIKRKRNCKGSHKPRFEFSVVVAVLIVGISSGCGGIWNSTVGSVKKVPKVSNNAVNLVVDGASMAAVTALAVAFPPPSVDFPEPLRITPLPDEVRYDEACFLCSHNSYSAVENGWFPYRQQFYGEAKQLDLGVRAFMFDTWNDGGRIVLSHGKPSLQKWIRPRSACRGEGLPSFLSRLQLIRSWLQDHPAEVLTLILENHVHNSDIFNDVIRRSGLHRIVLSSVVLAAYRKNANDDRWPSLGWMRRTNFRLVILSDWSDGNWLLPEWKHAIENRPGSFNVSQATQERSESARNWHRKRHLLILNYFPTYPLPLKEFEEATDTEVVSKMVDFVKHQIENFSYYNNQGAAQLIQQVRRLGLQGRYKGMTPTFLVLDNVHEGAPIRHVELLNKEARQRANGRKKVD